MNCLLLKDHRTEERRYEVENMDADRRVKIAKSDDEWRQELTPEQYHVTRQHGTERAFSNPLNGEKRAGMFNCVCCGAPLFSSGTKFDSGTGLVSRFRRSYPFAARSHTNARRRAGFWRVSGARTYKVAALAARFARQRGVGTEGTLATL